MHKSFKVLALIAAPFWAIVGAQAAGINMPVGSTVYMEMTAGACSPFGDCIGSNQPGPNPPNGIPLSSFTGGFPTLSATGSAEINAGQVRTFLAGRSAFMFASFEDMYTVHGAASGVFNIPVSLHVTGTMRTINLGTGTSISHQIVGANVIAEIGTFNHTLGPEFSEGLRVQPFNAGTTTTVIQPAIGAGSPQSVPIDITTSHTVLSLSVGSTFTLAFGVNSAFSIGEIDLLSTGAISFDLPPGVFLTSLLGGRFGETTSNGEVPLPGALPLFAAGLGVMGLLGWRRKQRNVAARAAT